MPARRAELAVGGAGAAVGVAAELLWGPGGDPTLAAAAVVGAALGAARRRPRAAWLAAAVALLAVAPQGELASSFALVPVHGFCAGRWDGRRAGLLGLLALIGAWELGILVEHGAGVPPLFLVPAGWGAGRALRERELVAGALAERARELEEEREAHATLSVRYERARIASELHDIVAHAITVMVVQATAGQRLAARDPQRTAEVFAVIAGAAHEAEDDMRRLVALLGEGGATGPAPDLALVDELVARAAGSGLDVTLRLEGERDGMPAALGQAAYRVVQEGLTNAMRYAAGAAVRVLVRGERDALVVQVENAPAPDRAALDGAGTGNGLRGLRERVGACGGTLAAGPTPDGGWRVSARLPRRVTAAAR